MTQRPTYPSHLECFRCCTRPHTHDLYNVFCGVLYVLEIGGQRGAFPHVSATLEEQ